MYKYYLFKIKNITITKLFFFIKMNIARLFTSSMEEQHCSNLMTLLDKTKDSKTRMKSLHNLIKLNKETEELSKLYNLNYCEIFDLLYKGLIRFIKCV